MTQRFVLHCIICIFFAAIGWWLYLQIDLDSYKFINSISVASYWFWLLSFLLFSWLFYLFLRKSSTKSWLIAQLIAFLIALIATIWLLIISYNYNKEMNTEEEIILQDQESDALQPEEILRKKLVE